MSTSLRICTEDDLDELRELSVNTFSETFALMNTPENMKKYLENSFDADKFRRELSDKNTEFNFLYHNDKLAGYLKLNESPSQTDINDKTSLEIERIYVLKEFQNHGLGACLMEKAISTAQERGKEYIWLGVWEKNEKALGFYKRHGFYKISEHTFVIGADRQTDYIMKLDLRKNAD